MPETHSPARPNTLKVRAGRILIGVGAVGFAYLANEQSVEPPMSAIEATTNFDALALGSPRDLDSFAITPDTAAIAKREPKVSRSKERTAPPPSSECWEGGLDDLRNAKTKKSLANIALACEISAEKPWFSGEQMDCLVYLWDRESGWNERSKNGGSGAYGIPQSLPGSKMSSAGKDWATNPATQIEWGLGYIKGRYGTPCDAKDAFNSKGWY